MRPTKIQDMHVTDLMFDMNITTSMPESVLCYELDTDSTSIWKPPFTIMLTFSALFECHIYCSIPM